ncbi:DivIVA domain-containing protein [Agrococcus citreus]|uniref:DivIVA domain-containing protein n=1 Tax=Agrococcus citreus TaxID=84643 RepID=A0ABN1YSF2_9MICO
MPQLQDAAPPTLRRAGWGRRGYAVEAVDRWGALAADALAMPAGPQADAAIIALLQGRLELGAALATTGDRYRKDDVDALVEWVVAAAPVQDAPASPPSGSSTGASAGGASLRPHELIEHRFAAPAWLAEGYSADSVDDWLDEAAAALSAHEAGSPASAPLTAADAEAARFPTMRGASAYRMDEVDELLDRVAAALRAHEARASDHR